MSGKYNKNIKYRKKFFNIYKDKKKIIKHNIKPQLKIIKPRFKDLTYYAKQAYINEMNEVSIFSPFFKF